MKKKILIVGGTGFIGFNLIKKLNKRKFEIFSLSRNKPKIDKKVSYVKYIYCNISNTKKLNYLFKKKFFDYVINFGEILTIRINLKFMKVIMWELKI